MYAAFAINLAVLQGDHCYLGNGSHMHRLLKSGQRLPKQTKVAAMQAVTCARGSVLQICAGSYNRLQ